TSSATGQTISINRLHRNSPQGVAYFIGTEKSIQGVITVESGLLADSLDIYVQDETGGMNVAASFPWPQPLDRGMEVQVTGIIDQHHGQTRIVVVDSTAIRILAEQVPVPEPLLLTCAQVSQTLSALGDELYESSLIALQNVRVVSSAPPFYRLSDYTGECDLLLPDHWAEPLPTDVFDAIGILRQIDDSPPYDSGYTIFPRTSVDILTPQSIRIVSAPVETHIAADRVDLQWESDAPASARLLYGLTENLELGTIEDTTRRTLHHLSVAGLEPATIYSARAVAFTPQSSDTSDVFYFCSAADQSSGEIQVYFTHSVDAELAGAEIATGNTDLAAVLIDRIDRAQSSIDICYYSFTHWQIAYALQRAKLAGVEIRLITDWREEQNESDVVAYLRDTVGIYAINDRFNDNDGAPAMHNKFMIFDHRLGDSGADDWLALGSANATYSGSLYNAENWLIINDQALCAAYTREFEEMWGSSGQIPGGRFSRMGARKQDNTPHRFNVNGVWIEQYMSPSDRTESRIIDALQSADHSAYFCLLLMTSSNLEDALKSLSPAIDRRGVLNQESGNTAVLSRLRSAGIDAHSLNVGSGNLMHHKYLLIDADRQNMDPIVVTGSHNWSFSAENSNDENTLIIHDARIANLYLQEFAKRYTEAGGSGNFETRISAPPIPETSLVTLASYPNPFNAAVRIVVRGTLSENGVLSLYDIRGRLVRQWNLSPDLDGSCQIIWDGCDDTGAVVSSGLYFVEFKGKHIKQHLKILLTR
ncbi:T9SS type A sorting domain-containing protein, partial [candidate division KSB1 bacterium]|nr:T9SS type A sorting domain-containing protein [candidate division KSB1 bacterium]